MNFISNISSVVASIDLTQSFASSHSTEVRYLGQRVVGRAVECGGHEAGGGGGEAARARAVQRHHADAQPVAGVHPRVDGRRRRAQQVPVQPGHRANSLL